MNLLTIDFGGRSVKYSYWNGISLLESKSFSTPKTWDEMLVELIHIKSDFENEFHLDGITLSCPGSVDNEKGIIYGMSAISYIHNWNIKEKLSQIFNLPVSIENDACCAALAETWVGVAKEVKHVVFVVIGSGVGGAIVYNGKIWHGSHLFGGEFGMMLMNIDGKIGFQTLSDLGSPVYMAERYCKRIGVDKGMYKGIDVFNKAEAGDLIAIEEIETLIKYLTMALFNIQLSIDPEMIVIGGGISANNKIIDELNKRVQHLFTTAEIKDFQPIIKSCHYRNDANLIGAVKNFYNEYELK